MNVSIESRHAKMEVTPQPVDGEPVRHHPRVSFPNLLTFFKEIRENQLSGWPAQAYEDLWFQTPKSLFVPNIIILSDPDGLQEVLGDIERFPKSPIQNRYLKPVLGEGLLTAEGEHWRKQRHAVQPAFSAQRLTGLIPLIVSAIEESCVELERQPHQASINVHDATMRMTLEILCRTMFDRVRVDPEKMGSAVTTFLTTFSKPDLVDVLLLPTWMPRPKNWRIRPAQQYFADEVQRILKERRADPSPPDDLLQMFLDAQDEQTGAGLSETEIHSNIITFFGAGHETTAAALTWTLYLLSQFPWAEQKIVDEVSSAIGSKSPTAGDYAKLKYTRMVFEEAMRLYPPAPAFERTAACDTEVLGRPVEKGTHIFVSPYVVHRHTKLWENPHKFDPGRFTIDAIKARHRFQYIPFNMGPRSCIGQSFAMMEGIMALACLVRDFHFELSPEANVIPQALITLRPQWGMPMKVTKR